MTQAPILQSVKVFHVPGLRQVDLEPWVHLQPHLRVLILFRCPELTRDAVDLLLRLPALERLGDFASFDVKRPQDIRRLQHKINEERQENKHLQSTRA